MEELDRTQSHMLEAFARGDIRAVNELVESYYAQMMTYLLRYGLNPADAEDVVQESLIKAARSVRKGARPDNLKAWLFTICRNTMRDSLRKTRRRQELPLENAAREPARGEDSPETAALRQERAEEVREAVRGLSPAHREVIILRFYHDFSLEEIARITGKNIGTVKSRLHYGMQRLKTQFDRGDVND